MGTFAAIVGIIAVLCTAMGVVVALNAIPGVLPAALTWDFWLVLAAVLFLSTIALLLGRSREY